MRIALGFLIPLLIGCSTTAHSSLFADSRCKAGYEYYFLNRAAANGDLYAAKLLLDGGANVDGLGYNTYLECGGGMEYSSPLMVAVRVYANEEMKGDPSRSDRQAVLQSASEMVTLLLDRGANPGIKEGESVTPLDVAIRLEHQPSIELLRHRSSH